MTRKTLCAFCISLMLTGCGQDSSPADAGITAETASSISIANLLGSPSAPASAADQPVSSDPLLGLGCGWTLASDADLINIVFPDKAARYWLALVPMTPGSRLRIDGRYPDARYFSFNSYDLALRPIDAIADAEIEPAAGGANPFTTPGVAAGGAYTTYLRFGERPAQPEASTFYSGSIGLGPLSLPNGPLVPLVYRTYVASGRFMDGGVGLPQLTLETADGRTLASLPTCSEPLLPNLGGLLPSLGLNELLNTLDYPDTLLPLAFPTAAYPPKVRVFYGLPETVLDILHNQLPFLEKLPLPDLPETGAGGFLSNVHNDYTTSAFSRRYGNVFVLRAKAPRYRSQPGLAFGQEQVRYWSLCQNEFATQRFTACSTDHETPLDDQGYFTVVVSDAADRPDNTIAAQHITWLPWGPYPDGLLLYRQMLASPDYAQAIANVPKGTPLAEVMADYTPAVSYCRREIFDQAGLTAAQRFDACVADQAANPPRQP